MSGWSRTRWFRLLVGVVAAVVVLVGTGLVVVWQFTPDYRTEFLVDTSLDAAPALKAVGDAVSSAAQNAGHDDSLALRRFGGNCGQPDNTAQVVGFGVDKQQAITDAASHFSSTGKATLQSGVLAAIDDFTGPLTFRANKISRIVVVTGHGKDACGGEQAAVLKAIQDRANGAGLRLEFRFVGYQMQAQEKQVLQQVSVAVGAPQPAYADTPADVKTALAKVMPPTAPPAQSVVLPKGADLHAADLKQITVPAGLCHTTGDVPLHGGAGSGVTTQDVSVDVAMGDVVFGDLEGNGNDAAAVEVGCGPNGGGNQVEGQGYVIVSGATGRPATIGFLTAQHGPTGYNFASVVEKIAITRGHIEVSEDYYQLGDPHSHPTGRATTTWTYADGKLTPGEPRDTTQRVDPHTADLKQITVPAAVCGTPGDVQLQDGGATSSSSGWGQINMTELDTVTFGDLEGNGTDVAAVDVACNPVGGNGDAGQGFVIVSGASGQLTSVGSITAQYNPHTGIYPPGVATVIISPHQIVANEVWYRDNDSHADPTGRATTTWTIKDGQLAPGQPHPTS
jgi:hypothetical protein